MLWGSVLSGAGSSAALADDHPPVRLMQGSALVIGVSRDGSISAQEGDSGQIMLVDTPTSHVIHTLRLNYPITTNAPPAAQFATFSSDDSEVAISWLYFEGTFITIHDVATGQLVQTLNILPIVAGDLGNLAFSPDKSRIALGLGSQFQLWDVKKATLISTMGSDSDGDKQVVFSSDGKKLYTARADGLIRVWSVPDGSLLNSADSGILNQSSAGLALAPNGRTLAVGGWATNSLTTLCLLDAATLNVIATVSTGQTVSRVVFSPDNSTVACDNAEYVVFIDAASGTITHSISTSANNNSNDPIYCLQFTARGDAIVVTGLGTAPSHISSMPIAETRGIATGALLSYQLPVDAAALSPDGGTLALVTAGYNPPQPSGPGWLSFVDVASGRVSAPVGISAWGNGSGTLSSVAYSADGTMLAVGGNIHGESQGGAQGVLELHKASGELITSLPTSIGWIYSVRFSPDGRRVVVSGSQQTSTSINRSGAVEIWDVGTGTLLSTIQTPEMQNIDGAAFNQDGSLLVIGGGYNSELELWNTATPTAPVLLSRLPTAISEEIMSVGFSTDGSKIVAGGQAMESGLWAGVVEVWDVATGNLLASPSVNGTYANGVACTPDGTTLYATTDTEIDAFSMADFSLRHSYQEEAGGGGRAISFDTLGKSFAFARWDGAACVFGNAYYTPLATITSASINPASVPGGTTVTGQVVLAHPAPNIGATVSLTSSNAAATVPATVTVPAGKTKATFTIATTPVKSAVTVKVTATIHGTHTTASFSVTPTSLTALTLNPTSVPAGSKSVGEVHLTGPAPAGGVMVSLSSSSSAAVVPATVAVAAGNRSASFTIKTQGVASATSATITAKLNGVTATASLAVQPVSFSVAVSPASVKGGTGATAAVTLASAAPSGGLAVSIASSNTKVASLASGTVMVPAGKTTGSVAITTYKVTSSTTVTLTATFGTAQTTSLKVTP
jgi:WD40 repeat protein